MRFLIFCTLFFIALISLPSISESQSDNPVPDIKINSQSGIETNLESDPKITIALRPGTFFEHDADWWLVWFNPRNEMYSFNLQDMSWDEGLRTTYQGNLIIFPDVELPNPSNMSEGMHYIYFAVDLKRNGILDPDVCHLDWVWFIVITAEDVKYNIEGYGTSGFKYPENENSTACVYNVQSKILSIGPPINNESHEIFMISSNLDIILDNPTLCRFDWREDSNDYQSAFGFSTDGQVTLTYCEVVGRSHKNLNPFLLRVSGFFDGTMEIFPRWSSLPPAPVTKSFSGEFDINVATIPDYDADLYTYIEQNCVNGLQYGLE